MTYTDFWMERRRNQLMWRVSECVSVDVAQDERYSSSLFRCLYLSPTCFTAKLKNLILVSEVPDNLKTCSQVCQMVQHHRVMEL